MGCYRPFANVYELNAHVCEGMHTGECDHEWEAEYHDVWIEATGHYEYGVIEEAYDEPVYEEMCVCRKCGAYFQNSEEAADHIIAVHGNEGSWTVADVITGYIHHEAVYGDVFVTDTQAHWERQVYRYHCIKCGEIRYPD